jgi:predicted ArsR family transcriptional regulator
MSMGDIRSRDRAATPTIADRQEATLDAVSALADPMRRSLYRFVRGASHPVTRAEAARACGISGKLAAFHLDKLVSHGLVDVVAPETSKLVGRPPKAYRASRAQLHLTIPERRYELLSGLLAAGIEADRPDEPVRAALERVAFEAGEELGRSAGPRIGRRPLGRERSMAAMRAVLTDRGYEPQHETGGAITVRNCPFESVARTSPDLVCSMNRAYVEGVAEGLGTSSVTVRVEPAPGRCCVVVEAVRSARGGPTQ